MILLRHGQSEFNLHFGATGQDPGIPDAPLTALGHRQAEAAAEALAGEDIRRILCSPYTRALQTAAPVARRLGLPVVVTPAVRERRGASCDIGSSRTDLAQAWPHLDFGAVEEVWWPPEDEPHDAFAARAALFHADATARPDWAHTLVVCHWGFIMALTGQGLTNGDWLRCAVSEDGRLLRVDPASGRG
ncbi:Putative phosphoserine phosphatase 2 [Methylobacterium crusticola]|uniref:Phosphoserine phosphatase 2 n=2 Tax=Methylobacterium crusticola TaxID=1697972 RepID=A0ABQ4QQF3_9HYPH|nr:histidine phosphatase family protein [Methylobacterium crusticola]GJD47432.1 Putative phosphoserine phosphatase 2 [Methylobacterium crusticola]